MPRWWFRVCRAAGAICNVGSAALVGKPCSFFLGSQRNARFQIHMFIHFLEKQLCLTAIFPRLVFQQIITFSHTILITILHAYVMVILAFSFFEDYL